MKNIEALVDEGGEISIGAVPPFNCIAAACDGSNCLAMLVRRDGESLHALIERLDKAIASAWSQDLFIVESAGTLTQPYGTRAAKEFLEFGTCGQNHIVKVITW